MATHLSDLLQMDINSESDGDDSDYSSKPGLVGHNPIPTSVIKLEPSEDRQTSDTCIDWTSCLVHRTKLKCGPCESWSEVSWERFCTAARERQDEIYNLFKDYIDGTQPLPMPLKELVKHHNCYANYVLPKAVKLAAEARLKSDSIDSFDEPSNEPAQSTDSIKTRSNVAKICLDKCIICQHDKRHPTKRWRQEETHRLTQKKSGKRLVEAATQRGDEILLRNIGGGSRGGKDLIAGDVLVHDTCRRQYVAERNVRYSSGEQQDSSFDNAFKTIAREIQIRVIEGKDVLHLSDIRDQMIDTLRVEYGVDADNYRNQSLKMRLQQHFGDEICFWYPNKWRLESELVFSNQIPTGMVLEVGAAATRALEDQEDDIDQVRSLKTGSL